jgi:5'-deoxynucleotidase YfbR-like HD superfamily hydrolase
MEEPEKERLHDGNPWIQVSYGGKFHYLNPEPEEIYIEDIAHALSLNCRFNGHTERFYSVAQHSCMVAKHVMEYSQNPIWGLAALLHDAAEAYIGGPKWDLEEYFEPYKEKIHALTPANAEREFMIFFRALEEWRGSGTTSPAWGP